MAENERLNVLQLTVARPTTTPTKKTSWWTSQFLLRLHWVPMAESKSSKVKRFQGNGFEPTPSTSYIYLQFSCSLSFCQIFGQTLSVFIFSKISGWNNQHNRVCLYLILLLQLPPVSLHLHRHRRSVERLTINAKMKISLGSVYLGFSFV